MKIIIAGDGKVGTTLVRKLAAEGYDLTLIDSNQDVLEGSMEHFDVMAIHGNCAAMKVLLQADVQSADLLIAATGADEINLICCTTAHGLNPKLHTIARIRNPEYIDQIYDMRDIFALSMTINPELQAAQEIERLMKYPGFLKRESFAKGRVEIVELRIDADSRLCNVSLSELNALVHCKVLVCAVLRNGETMIPNGAFVLRQDDRIFVTAPTNALATLLKSLGIISHKVGNAILAGGGRVSYYLAQRLLGSGIDVKIIEQDARRCAELAELLPQARIIHGDASNMALLAQENMAQCDALVTLTGLDEMNMIISLYGKRSNVPQVITKLGRMESVDLINALLLGSVVCPKELSCNTIVRYVRAVCEQSGAARSIHTIADGQAEAIEFIADETTLHCGEALKKLRFKKNVLVACITRGAQTEIPNGDSAFLPGDTVIIVSSGDAVLYQLNDIFA